MGNNLFKNDDKINWWLAIGEATVIFAVFYFWIVVIFSL